VGATLERCKKGDSWPLDTWAWVYIIEVAGKHPDRIIRKPKIVLTDDDKAVVRRHLAGGYKWLVMEDAGRLCVLMNEPIKIKGGFIADLPGTYIPSPFCLFPWATHEGSPYYLPDFVGGVGV